MKFVLPLRPSSSSKAPKTPRTSRTTKTLQPPPESPRRRPSLATRAGVVKRRSSVVTTFNAPSMSFFEAMFGDDFPDVFAHGDGRSCKSRKTLLDLPAEILEIVWQTLSKMDLKQLRLTSRELAETVELRIDRVYISPNRANLDCLNNILNHPRYRLQVQEIVWDDAQLDVYPTLQEFCQALDRDDRDSRMVLEDHLKTFIRPGDDNDSDYESISVEDCVQEDGRLTDIGKAILLSVDDRKSRDTVARNAATMSIQESYVLYQKLYQDEKEIIERRWDVNGLQRALTELANLKRITLTSEVWRPWNPVPTYDTPFFRALPAGFRKPSVWPWCGHHGYQESCLVVEQPSHQFLKKHLPTEWRGYSIIMSSLLAFPAPHLQEFILDAGHEMIGLHHELFNSPNIDYINTIRVLRTTHLKKLKLSVTNHVECGCCVREAYPVLGLLQHVIRAAPHLEDLDLLFKVIPVLVNGRFPFDDGFLERNCPRLKHLALRRAIVRVDWLFNLVTQLKLLETVILDKVRIDGPIGSHAYETVPIFFTRLKDHFVAASHQGPSFTWIQELWPPSNELFRAKTRRWQVLDDELDAFLYDGGELPFNTINEVLEQDGEVYKPGLGWIMDSRDPMFRRNRRDMSDSFKTLLRNR